jgi:hypothetical protein
MTLTAQGAFITFFFDVPEPSGRELQNFTLSPCSKSAEIATGLYFLHGHTVLFRPVGQIFGL